MGNGYTKRHDAWDFSGCPVVKTGLPLQGVQVWSLVEQLKILYVMQGGQKKSYNEFGPSPLSALEAPYGQERAGFTSEKNRMGFKKRFLNIENWESSKNSEFAMYSPYKAGHQSKPQLTHTPRMSKPPCLTLKYKWPRISRLLKKTTKRKETDICQE